MKHQHRSLPRALASRYGDPDYLLAEDWIPEVPGINAPGDYMRDYAPNPGKIALQTMTDAMKGSYKHYFPPAGTKTTVAPGAKPASAGPGGGQWPFGRAKGFGLRQPRNAGGLRAGVRVYPPALAAVRWRQHLNGAPPPVAIVQQATGLACILPQYAA